MVTGAFAKQPEIIKILLLTLTSLILINCAATRPKPGFHHNQDGTIEMFKRFEQVMDKDYIHHWSGNVYFIPRNEKSLIKKGGGFKEIYEIWGTPDWVRRPYKSNHGDKVHEWVYLDLNQMFQFVDGKVVYEGPVTDYEQLLIRRGYPQRAINLRESNGEIISTLIYTTIWGSELDQYRFENGMLSFREEGI
jgi:hypothetical protein